MNRVPENLARLTRHNDGAPERRRVPAPSCLVRRKELPMMDLVMLAIAAGLFAVSVAYTVACDRL
jgi:hypothetical protein